MGKKGKTGFLPEHTANVTEDARAQIYQLLEKFKASNDTVYTFKASLSKQERAMVHLLCRKFGLKSKSSGKGDQRHVSVYQRKKKSKTSAKKTKKKESNTLDEKKHISSFALSEKSKRVLVDLFLHYPPGEDQSGEGKLDKQTEKAPKSQGRKDDIFLRPPISKNEIAKKVESLAQKVEKSPRLKEICRKRSRLPIASFKDAITSTVANNQVVLICGETGCGKTTQVPQYLLDYMWAKGESCKILCTQPRRISAITVSERIAHERGETIGESVGYKIRLEAKGGRQSSVVFCTSGVLLRVLVSSRESHYGGSHMKAEKCISEITHIVVDEIHERDRYSDFMLTILRDLLLVYPDLRLVLMSATIDAERFSEYFGGCPIIRVPGFTHPVKTFYLEDVLSILRTPKRNHLNTTTSSNRPSEEIKLNREYQIALDEAIEMSCSNEEVDSLLELISSEGKPEVLNYQHSSTGVTPLMVFAGKGKVGDICTLLSLGADCRLQARDGSTALDWANRGGQSEAAEIIREHMEAGSSGSMEEEQLLQKYMANVNPELIDYVLIEQLLKKVCMESKDGAILVFLPGWEDIYRTQKALLSNPFFKDSQKFHVLPLHSMVPSAEQKKVFQQPPQGCRKIILSTNIAETSVTIDDVVYVIDTGRMKEKSYDPYSNVSTLQSSWISKASAKQREGRAGRCQPGVCYHLYSKLKAVSLADFQVPEIKRMPIEELCLQVKMLDPNCKVDEFLKKTLDPPVLETINNAIAVLQDIGALSLDEQLTEMGKKLGSLPVHPLTSRMLFFSILLNCLDPALTLACTADYRDPFSLPMLPHDRHRADAARAKLASLYGGHSDQLAIVAAFDCWKSARDRGLESWFCSEYFVSSNIMSMLSGMRQQLLNELKRSGFVPDDVLSCSMNGRDPGIVRAVVVAGLYPRVGRLLPPVKIGKAFLVETGSGKKARLLARSIMSKFSSDELFNEADEGPLLVYDEVTRGDAGLQVRNCTAISPLPLLLLAKEIAVVSGEENRDDPAERDHRNGSHAHGKVGSDEAETGISVNTIEHRERIMNTPDSSVTVVVDGWISFKSTALEVAQIYCLRERLSVAVLFKISNPRRLLSPPLGASIYAIACLMAYDGLTGISLPMASPVDILTSLMNAPAVPATKMSRFAQKKKDHGPRTSKVQTTNTATSTEKKKKDHAPRACEYFLRSKASQNSSTHAQGVHVVQGEMSQPESLPPAQTKPVLVQPPITSPPQEGPTSVSTLVSPPPVPVKPTLKKRKTKNKPQKQPAGAILPPVQRKQVLEQPRATTGVMFVKPPLVQATLKKRKRKNKSRMNEMEPAGAVLPPVQTMAMLVEQSARTTAQEKPISGPSFVSSPSASMQVRPTANPGLGVLVGYGLNHYGPYGPRGR